jgi:hypothetical protein
MTLCLFTIPHRRTSTYNKCDALFGLYCNRWNGLTLKWEVNLRLVAFTNGLYAVETAMTGALTPKQSSRCSIVRVAQLLLPSLQYE